MPHITADRVRESSTTTGTGNITVAGALTSFRSFASVSATNDTFYYTIAADTLNEWEVGIGTYVSANTIARTTVLASSNANALVNFSAGTKDVFITAPASRFLQSNNLGSYGDFTAGTITATLNGNANTVTNGVYTTRTISTTSPVTGGGDLSANRTIALAAGYGDTQNPFGSKTANFFLAAPNGSAGAPTFRAIVAADIPTLNQNTTGSAATLTTTRTIWGQNFNGGANVTGALTSVGNITGTGAVTLTATSGTLGLVATGANTITATTNGTQQLSISSAGALTMAGTSHDCTNASTVTFSHTNVATPVAFAFIKAGSSTADGSQYGVLNLRRTNHTNASAVVGASLFFELKDDTGTLREYAGISGRKTVAGASGGQLDFHNYARAIMGSWSAVGFNLSTSFSLTANSTRISQTNTSTWSGDAGAGFGKLEYHSNRWYINAGSDSTEILRLRRGATDVAWLNNSGALTLSSTLTADSAEFTGLGTNGDPGADDLYVGGYGIQGSRAAAPIYVHNHGAGGIRISSGSSLGTANGILVEANQTTVTGLLTATTKSFTIKHPTKEGKRLRYGSLEGPENGIYVRGKLEGSVIELPEYWTKLVDPDSITVQLTPIGKHQKLYVEDIRDNKVYVGVDLFFTCAINCFYYVLAERADVEKLQTEID